DRCRGAVGESSRLAEIVREAGPNSISLSPGLAQGRLQRGSPRRRAARQGTVQALSPAGCGIRKRNREAALGLCVRDRPGGQRNAFVSPAGPWERRQPSSGRKERWRPVGGYGPLDSAVSRKCP